jgi:hypothetical protein
MDRWYEDGTMVRKYAEQAIKAGALRTIASQFVGQTLQERAGESEMSDAINAGCSLRRDRIVRPVGVVKWILQTEPADAGILTVFFLPVWGLLLVLGLLIGRRLGLLATGGKRVLQR